MASRESISWLVFLTVKNRLVFNIVDRKAKSFGFSEIVWFLEQNRLVFRESFGFQSKIVWFSENRLVFEPDAKKVKIILNLKMTE